MRKVCAIFIYCIVITTASAQSISLIFEDDISIDSINKIMDSNKIPLFFEEEGFFDTVSTKIYYNGIYVIQTHSNLIRCFSDKHGYLLFFYDYAGYDRVLFIDEKFSSIYYSDKFNYKQSSTYKYFLKKKCIKILYLETRTKEFVPIYRYDGSKDFIL